MRACLRVVASAFETAPFAGVADHVVADLLGEAPDVPDYVAGAQPEPEGDAEDLAALEAQMAV